MPFFIRKKQGKFSTKNQEKRKRQPTKKENSVKKPKQDKRNGLNEVISSDEDASDHREAVEDYSTDEETQQEKKLRLTKKYLEKIEKEESEKVELSDLTKDAVAHRLKEEALEEAGRLQKKKAHEYENVTPEVLCTLKGHKLSITCLVVSSDEKYVYSASKDCSVIKWSVETSKKVKTIPGGRKGTESTHIGHTAHVLSIALSSDDKFLATGCRNSIINIWNPNSMELLKTFKGHKDAVCGLTFQRGSHQLISASHDRSLKLWNLDEMGYVETLFGHQDSITSIDSFLGETVLTSGGRDNTIRIWKIVEESQLVFQGHGGSIDCVCVTSPQQFVSGADDGSISLWGTHKKKPIFKLQEAHGADPDTKESYWITTVCALHNTDLLASGSQDGHIRLWRRDDERHTLQPVSTIPVKGFVNTLQFTPSGKYLIAGVGQEHRIGRWWRNTEGKNIIVIYSWF